MERIGFIGLGNMGFHMASNLLKAGFPVIAHDVNVTLESKIRALGSDWVHSPKALADAVEIIVISLPTPQIVEDVLIGRDGVLWGKTARIVVDTSTTGPAASIRIAEALRAKSIDLIDAPVSGGVTGAEEASLTIMSSGPKAIYDRVVEILQLLGSNLFYLGEQAGQGQLMKVINNTLCAAATLSAFEGLVLGSKGGLDSRTMLDVINASSGRSFATQVKIPQCVLERNFPLRFTTNLIHKDVKLCIDESERLGVPMWVNTAARQMLMFAISQGDGPIDYGEIIKRYEQWGNTQFGQA